MPGKTARGRFVWHELYVPDTAKAHQFYSKVVGWKTQAFEHDPSYQMFAISSGPLGGTVAETAGAPRWLPFIGTDDIDETVSDAEQLGAKVVTPVTSIPNGGRWAALLDPQGAQFAVYQSANPPSRETPPKRGEFSWHELGTSDYKAALAFYSQLFGWETTSEVDMGPPVGVYSMYGRKGVPAGGIFTAPAEMGSPSWVGYIRVKDVHKAAKKAQAIGAKLINGPMEVPGGDWIAQFIDPQGAMFAVHALQADMQPEAAPEGAPAQGALDLTPSSQSAAKPEVRSAPAKAAVKSKPKARPVAKKKAKVAAKSTRKSKVVKKKASKKRAAPKRGAKRVARKVAKKAAKKKARRAK